MSADAGRTRRAEPALGRIVASGLRWASASRLLTQLLTWATTLWVVRLLSPADYGLAAMASMLAGYLTMWNELGLSITLIQRRVTDERTLRSMLGLLLVLGSALCLIMVACAPLIGAVFSEPRITPLATLVALTFLIMPFCTIPQATLSINMNFKALSLTGLIAAAVGAAVTLLLARLGAGAYALIAGTLVIAAARAVCLNYFAPFLRRPSWRPRELRSFAAFSGNVMLARTIFYWHGEADNAIVGRALGAHALGAYSLGRQLALMPMDRVSEIINMVAMPAYASVGHDQGRVRDAYIRALGLTATLAFPLFWGLGCVAQDLVDVVLGEKWQQTAPVLQLLCLVMPLRTVGALNSAPLLALGRSDLALRFIAIPAILVTVSLLIGIHWGVLGAATAWVIAYPPSFVLSNWSTRVAFGSTVRSLIAPLAAPALCASLMAVALLLTDAFILPGRASFWMLTCKVLLGAVGYAGFLYLFARRQFRAAWDYGQLLMGKR